MSFFSAKSTRHHLLTQMQERCSAAAKYHLGSNRLQKNNIQLAAHPKMDLPAVELLTFKMVSYSGFISQFCHQNWDSISEDCKTKQTVKTELMLCPSHIIYLTEGRRRRWRKLEQSWPPQQSFICSALIHLRRTSKIWSCHRLANRDLRPLETNDSSREGQQLTANGVTILGWWWRGGCETSYFKIIHFSFFVSIRCLLLWS